jgi:hypothetical protein
MPVHPRWWRLLLPACFLLAVGCGSESGPNLAPVRGQVFYRGRPVTTGTIVFASDPSRGTSGPLARGEIQPDGSYSLQTGDSAGAVVGWHRVTVVAVLVPAAPEPGQPFVMPRPLVPTRYADPELSGLTCEVKAGKENGINFNLD